MKKIIAIMSLCIVGCVPPDEQQTYVENEAVTFGSSLGLKDVRATCVSSDSDNDGYVSCTVLGKDTDGKSTTLLVECAEKAVWWQTNQGCKVAQAKVVMKNQN